MTYPADSIEEMIKISAIYGLTSMGMIAKFVGAIIKDEKCKAKQLWIDMVDVHRHLDAFDYQEIEDYLFK